MHRRTDSEIDRAEVTIEFLRARLASERSMCKAARERALELEEQIFQLEHKLEGEISHRKKAELTTKELLLALHIPPSSSLNNLSSEFSIDHHHHRHQRKRNNRKIPRDDEFTSCVCRISKFFSFPRCGSASFGSKHVTGIHSNKVFESLRSSGTCSSPREPHGVSSSTPLSSNSFVTMGESERLSPMNLIRGLSGASAANMESLKQQVLEYSSIDHQLVAYDVKLTEVRSPTSKFQDSLQRQQRQLEERSSSEDLKSLELSSNSGSQNPEILTVGGAPQGIWFSSGESTLSNSTRRIGKSCRTIKKRNDISR